MFHLRKRPNLERSVMYSGLSIRELVLYDIDHDGKSSDLNWSGTLEEIPKESPPKWGMGDLAAGDLFGVGVKEGC